jgi:biotin carboxylase
LKKILLLGGSYQQIPAIEYAKKKGYYTILCDYLPDNPGQHYVDKFYCISTTDKKSILKVAKKEKIDGIVAYASDPAAPTAAYVAEKMGLPGNPYKSVCILTNKSKFRELQKKYGFNVPNYGYYTSTDNAIEELLKYKLPVLVKPVDSSGSKGISIIRKDDNYNYDYLKTKLEKALKYSRIKKIIIEEYVQMKGYQVAGDGFSIDGNLVFRCFGNDHFNSSGINPFVPISASFPYCMPKNIHNKIHSEIQRLFHLLSLGTGAYNFDIRINNNNDVFLMEIGPRNGGNYIPQVIKYATGIDMIDYTLKAAIGENCDSLHMVEPKGCWSYYAIHSQQAGTLKEIKIDEEVEKNYIIEKYLNYKIGDYVPLFLGSNANLGILIMKFESMEKMLEMMDNSEKWIEVIVE